MKSLRNYTFGSRIGAFEKKNRISGTKTEKKNTFEKRQKIAKLWARNEILPVKKFKNSFHGHFLFSREKRKNTALVYDVHLALAKRVM